MTYPPRDQRDERKKAEKVIDGSAKVRKRTKSQ